MIDRAAVDHRVGARRAAARLDPRLPHGRAGDHLLRPRPAEGVPRRPRGHRRRHPRRPRRRRDHRRRRPARSRTSPTIVQVASGSANPLRYRHLVDLVRAWFTEHPLYDAEGQPIVVPEWSFPGRGRVQRQLERAKGAHRPGRAGAAVAPPPRQAGRAGRPRSRRSKEEVERALAYVELYGAYAECEAIYGVDRLLARWDRSTPEDQATFCFDPRVIDWSHYVHDVHLPSVVEHARVRTTPGGRTGEKREDRLRRQVLAPERHLAAFDLENTLIASNVVASYSWLATRRLPARRPAPLRAARRSREAPVAAGRSTAATAATSCATSTGATRAPTPRSSRPTPSRCSATSSSPSRSRPPSAGCASTARLGHRTVLITGALDFVIEPLRPLFDDIVCPSLGPPPGRHLPRRAHRRAAHRRGPGPGPDGLRRRRTASTSPSRSPTPTRPPTCPMLEAVGFPVAVNPETRLAALARKRGWLVEHFDKAPGVSTRLLPDRPGVGPPPQPPRPARSRPREGARVLAEAGQVRGRDAWRAGSSPRCRREGRAARAARRRPARAARARAGCGCARAWPASAAPTSPPSTARRRATSSRSCRSRSCPATRSWATSTTAPRVVVDPVLSCVARGIDPPCAPCADGRINHCERLGLRPPRARPAVRVLRVDRRRLVHADGRPRGPARRRARRPDRRGRGAGRADRLRGARGRPGRGRRGRDRSRCSAPARSACSRSPRSGKARPVVELIATAKHPHQRALAARARRRRRRGARRARPGRAGPHRLDAARLRPAHRRRRRRRRLRRVGRLDRPGACASPRPAARSTPSACPA